MWICSVPTAVVKGRNGIDVGRLLDEALADCRMQQKAAASLQHYPDQTQFSKALTGQAPLDLWRMRHLPNEVWQAFLPKLGSALIRQFLDDEIGDQRLRMAKAEPAIAHAKKDVA